MCRPEKPLTTSNQALRELQEWLREMRERTGQGYRALAVRAGCHATTLQRAASGETVPKLQTVLSYARACDASPEEARRLWKQARYEETRLARGGRGRPAPRPQLIRDFVDLGAALVELYEKAGSPPLRIMEQRAGGYGSLPRSSAYRIVNKQAMPHGLRQFQAYLRACEVPEAEWPDWEIAWTRAWRHEKQDDSVGTFGPQVVDPWFLLPPASTTEAAYMDVSTKLRQLREFYRAELVLTRGSRRGGRVLATRVEPIQRVEQRRGRSRRHPPRRPGQQMALPIGESEPGTSALF
ncbi:helix-turn-helix domain-containing protein [Streptomyces variegatus]|jgi:transcriptional regulator with XRE-family HTH domain|uniref:helix-turn-helix domain-containing protein n=1 Tax=Streptomyces variegatus TaxID=284040 RepID=UPI003C2C5A7D